MIKEKRDIHKNVKQNQASAAARGRRKKRQSYCGILLQWYRIYNNTLLQTPFYLSLLEDRQPCILKNGTELLYFCTFLYPDPSIHEHGHQASFDSLMLVNVMSALIDPTHRDKPRADECGTGELRLDD